MALHPGREQRDSVDPKSSQPENLRELDSIRRALQENEDWYRDLVEHSQDLLCIHDLQGNLLSVNPAPARMLGYTVEELLRIPMREIIPSEYHPEFEAYLEQIARTGEAHGLMVVMTRTGERRTWEFRNTLRTQGVTSPIVRGMAHDVTERRQLEIALLQREADLRHAQAVAHIGSWHFDMRRHQIVLSDEAYRIVGLPVGSPLTPEQTMSLTYLEDQAHVRQSWTAALAEGHYEIESRMLVHGELRWIRMRIEIEYANTQPVLAVGTIQDITESKKAAALLEASEHRFRTIFDRSPIGIALTDTKTGKLLQVNAKYCEIVGRTEQDVLGRSFQSITHPDDLPEDLENMRKLGQAETRYFEVQKRYIRLDGSICWAKVLIVPMWAEGEQPTWHVALVQDITDRKRAEEALRESEARERAKSKELQTVLDTVPVAVFIASDVECRHMTTNRAGYEQLRLPVGANISKSAPFEEERPNFRLMDNGVEVPAEELPMQRAAATATSVFGVPLSLVFEDGTERHTLFNAVPLLGENGKPVGVVGTSIDITERKRAEDAVRERERTQKLILDHLQVGVILSSVGGDEVLYQNPTFIELFGYTVEDRPSIEEWWPRAYPDPAYREWVAAEWRRRITAAATTQSEIEPMEVTVVCRDGSKKYMRILAKVIGDLNFITFVDLTERKQAEEARRQSEERFRVALLGSPINVFNQDHNLRYTWIYNLYEGWTEEDFLGHTDEEIFEAEDAARMTELKKRVLQTGQKVREEITITARGKTYYCDLTIEPLLDAAGTIIGVNCACGDVTYLHEIMEELRLAKERLTEEKLYLEHAIDTELGFGEIVGQSKAMQSVMMQVAKVASSDSTVLLLGETGTGKELLARAVHNKSRRASNSFIKMNCAAIPSGLLESELFGHEKGAFTGAVARKIGRLELASRGTLFLDEVGEIPLELQSKLLRVLQDQEFERLGSTQTIKGNFRLVAATNRDLRRSVTEKQFRSDLYYRLNVFPIRVPPLRERREDIRALIEHFVRKHAGRMGRSITSVPRKTMDALEQSDWPGNIRELENFIERSVIFTQGSVLQAPLSELVAEKEARKKGMEPKKN